MFIKNKRHGKNNTPVKNNSQFSKMLRTKGLRLLRKLDITFNTVFFH